MREGCYKAKRAGGSFLGVLHWIEDVYALAGRYVRARDR